MSRILYWIVLAATIPALLAQISGRYPMPRQVARLMWLIWTFLLLSSLSGLFIPPDSPLEIPIAILLLALSGATLVMAVPMLRRRDRESN
jgi:hypothetical protein